MRQFTPLPWHLNEHKNGPSTEYIILHLAGDHTEEVGRVYDRDDARAILHAVNAHEALLAACKLALAWENGLDCGDHNCTTVVAALRDAIAKAT